MILIRWCVILGILVGSLMGCATNHKIELTIVGENKQIISKEEAILAKFDKRGQNILLAFQQEKFSIIELAPVLKDFADKKEYSGIESFFSYLVGTDGIPGILYGISGGGFLEERFKRIKSYYNLLEEER